MNDQANPKPDQWPLLPLNIIKKAVTEPLESAEFRFISESTLTICVAVSSQTVLIARKQGDQPRVWRSVDRAIDFVKAHFAIKTINIKLN